MKIDKLVPLLVEAARKSGFTVRTEEGNFRGGQCWFADQRLIILNRRMSMEERADLLAKILATEDIESLYVVPEIRGFIEKYQIADREENNQDDA
ncbi:MAG: hypothetical protein ACOZB3_08200 [Calditrichota bacterium]